MWQQTVFQQCPDSCRPRIRWWLPGANLQEEELTRELEDMKRAGIGAVELSFLGQNGQGWGSESWFSHLAVILREAARLGLQVDVMPGVHWVTAALGIPIHGDASEKELVVIEETIDPVQTQFSVPAPAPRAPGSGNHDFDSRTAVTAARLVGVTVRAAEDDGLATVLMDPGETWIDLQSYAAAPYVCTWTPPHPGQWIISAFWSVPTGILIRGVPAIDHFGCAGSWAVTDYWDTQLAQHPEVRTLLCGSGTYLFLDSLELGTEHYWTDSLLREFQIRRGYALLPWLHCVYTAPKNADTEKIQRDFFQTLTELLGENYFQAFSAWCSRYGLELRAQSCYGIRAEMARTSMYIPCPETERLGFTDSIDGYRGQAGTVHIQGRPIYSSELAPVLGAAWRQTWRQMLWHTYRCFAAGVNQTVWHGYAYRTDLEDREEQWPGYSPMAPLFSEELGDRIPSWQFVRPVNDAIARQQWFVQQGTAIVDLAVYRHSDWEDKLNPDYLNDDTLDRWGYSYDFISPAHLLLEGDLIADGRLFPNGPNYKALVFIHQTHLPAELVHVLLHLAEAGFPMLFVGAMPSAGSYYFPVDGDTKVRKSMAELRQYKTTEVVPDLTQVTAWLQAHDLLPDAKPNAPAALLTAHRRTECAELYYIFHQSKQAGTKKTSRPDAPLCTNMTLRGTGCVYRLDPWTGNAYQLDSRVGKERNTVEVVLELAGNDAALLLVTEDPVPTEPEPVPCREQLPLDRWDISLSVWLPSGTDHLRTETKTYMFSSCELKNWEQLTGKPVSGTAQYRTKVSLPECRRCVLSLGQVIDLCRVKVNGCPAPAVDPVTTAVDISSLIHPGTNTLEVEVGSNLYGVMCDLGRTFETMVGPNGPRMPGLCAGELPDAAGLLGPVILQYTPRT